jgi:class 3 adenylate cyclase/pimeloyl-ACP methyl ester carboxylesterase
MAQILVRPPTEVAFVMILRFTWAVPENQSRKLAAVLAADIAGYSALMGADEPRTVRDLKGHQAVVLPMIGEYSGRIIDTAGDGILAEFASVVNALECAVAIQRRMAERNTTVEPARHMQFRIGVNVGDVIYDEVRIYGDGINIAARLEGIAEPGGVFISRQVYDQVDGKVALSFRRLGPQNLKNIVKPVEVFAVEGIGGPITAAGPLDTATLKQEIKYCRTSDGVRLAYAIAGSGPPLVKAGNWMNHLEYDWESPVWRHVFRGLAKDHTLIRYDARGNGLSDWDVDEVSLNAWVNDLETVADAADVERFPLLGISQGCAVSVAYAVRHPERVSHLILYGGFAVGGRKNDSPDVREQFKAMSTLIRLGWGADNPTFRQIFTGLFMPGASQEQMDFFNELQRRTTSPECAFRYREAVGDFDVRDLLPRVSAPTLVMHVRGDAVVPVESGRTLAAGIPGARFVAVQGQNHLFLENEPASQRFFEEIELFLKS